MFQFSCWSYLKLAYALPVTCIEKIITAIKANIFWLDFKLLFSRLCEQISQKFSKKNYGVRLIRMVFYTDLNFNA